jgi:hypothetical protein
VVLTAVKCKFWDEGREPAILLEEQECELVLRIVGEDLVHLL